MPELSIHAKCCLLVMVYLLGNKAWNYILVGFVRMKYVNRQICVHTELKGIIVIVVRYLEISGILYHVVKEYKMCIFSGFFYNC